MRIDAKGIFLLILGASWTVFGVYVARGFGSTPDGAPHILIPDDVRAFGWILPGLLGIAAAWFHPLRAWALALLIVTPVVRIGSYAWAGGVWLSPLDGGAEQAPYSIAHYVPMATAVVMVSFIGDRGATATDRSQP